MAVTITVTREMQAGFPQTVETSLTNLADKSVEEMRKLAPFANPSQYPNGYSGNPGDLAASLVRQGEGKGATIISGVPYALMRNEVNFLNPQTLFYIDRAVENVLAGQTSQWWQVSPSAYLGSRSPVSVTSTGHRIG